MAPSSPQPVAVAVLLLALRLPLCNTQQARGGGTIAAAPSAFRVPSASGAARPLCDFFARGHCRFGARCRNRHEN